MKKATTLFLFTICMLSAFAQGYDFTVVKENPITPVKNQNNTGTCWSFSSIGFIESELLRMGKGEHDLSEMYAVRRNYTDKAVKYIRTHGTINFAQGGAFADVIQTINEYGVVPEEAYDGLNYGETQHKHGELAAGLTGYLSGIMKNDNKQLSTAWLNGYNSILDAYFGQVPAQFQYQGKTYTPHSLAKDLGLDSDNYISLTSFTHHPFYKPFAIEIPDNWRWALSYNLPIDEMMRTIDSAIENGYTVAWASDVSEIGFTRNGLGIVPDEDASENVGSDQARWLGLSQTERTRILREKLEQGPVKEKNITQEMRQETFDNYLTTDDHGMQIYGIAKDQLGNKYYMVKNSWGNAGKYDGLWYVSEPFVKFKTMSIVIHKDALPKDVAKKL